MLYVRRVVGRSMEPFIYEGDAVVFAQANALLHEGAVVLARVQDREVVKRVTELTSKSARLEGDNTRVSTDSRHYGPVPKSAILGSMIFKFPRATAPPKVLKSYAPLLGRAAAVVLILAALIHLFRIDTLVPLVQTALGSGPLLASLAVIGMVASEVFAVPFLLRMKLSPLAHAVSGGLAVFAPLWWLLLGVWSYDLGVSTGQLGHFVATPANAWLLLINSIWVGFNYYTLYTLGLNRVRLAKK